MVQINIQLQIHLPEVAVLALLKEVILGEVHFFAKHDDRKGHHYYTRWLHRPTQSCIVVMTLAVILTMTN